MFNVDGIIKAANKLQSVADARITYIKEVNEYKQMAAEYGVSERAIENVIEEIEKIGRSK